MVTSNFSKIVLSLGLMSLVGLAGCSDDPSNPGGGGCASAVPFEDDWEVVFDGTLPADLLGDNAVFNVTDFTIGGTTIEDNYMNRGDIEVYYTLPDIDAAGQGTIRVEMQRFTSACTSDEAQANFTKMKPWIYSGSVKKPDEKEADEEICSDGMNDLFLPGCNIRVYYEGLSQPVRDGANLRVFLPRNYRGNINLVTEDNLWPDGSYYRRGDVRIKDLYGTATVQLGSGTTEIKLADDILASPRCDPDPAKNLTNNEFCDTFVDPNDMMMKPWAQNCGCADKLGSVAVTTVEPEAADITVDAPADFWTVVTLNNNEPAQVPGAPETCTTTLVCDDFTECTLDDANCTQEEPWTCRASVTNKPSGAIEGAGYGLALTSTNCSDVNYHPTTGSYGGPPETERRGYIEVCSGCVDIPTP